MIIVETHVFTKLICGLLPDEQLRRVQLALVQAVRAEDPYV